MTALSSSRRSTLDEVGLHENHRRELIVSAELELRVIPARVAVVAAVGAAAIRVQRPLERHALHAIQGRAARDFLIRGGIGAAVASVRASVPPARITSAIWRVVGEDRPRSNSSGAISSMARLYSPCVRHGSTPAQIDRRGHSSAQARESRPFRRLTPRN